VLNIIITIYSDTNDISYTLFVFSCEVPLLLSFDVNFIPTDKEMLPRPFWTVSPKLSHNILDDEVFPLRIIYFTPCIQQHNNTTVVNRFIWVTRVFARKQFIDSSLFFIILRVIIEVVGSHYDTLIVRWRGMFS